MYLVEDILIIAENGIKSLIGQYNITMYVNGFFDMNKILRNWKKNVKELKWYTYKTTCVSWLLIILDS